MSVAAAPAAKEEEHHIPVALVVAVVMTAILDILDITIVNVAMPHMLGAFGATPDQITWVLTSYLIATAIVMPLTGFLSNLLGRRRLLMYAISGFVVSSALCGTAQSLEAMVVFRLMQGGCGAVLIPLAQAILFDAFPSNQRGQAMAVFGLGVMVAPVMGPPFGGWLTEVLGWRSVFYVNVPLGVVALLLALGQLPRREIRRGYTDWTGLLLMAAAIGSLQFVLDQGQSLDWFSSRWIQFFAAVAIVAGAAFLLRGWGRPNNIVDLALFRDRNFAAATLTIFAFGIGMFGTIALLPLLTQKLMGYPADTAGLLFMPRAIASAITLALAGGLLVKIFDPRWLVGAGLLLAGAGTFFMAEYSLDVDAWALIWPGIIIGVGMGLFFVPLTTIAFDTIPKGKSDEAAGLFSVLRSIGASTGIAIVGWLLVRQSHVHWQELTAHASPSNPAVYRYLERAGLSLNDQGAAPLLAREIARQAQMLAFVDLFWFLSWATLGVIVFVFLMQKPVNIGKDVHAH
ncbi:MAG: DHA2 family efflux MFS transporter permease subunit [Pseudomonadota bacterium]|nr:DHA2 family efflux MFS transporter permease subunit [Pseudomonadota bacterium]